MSVYRMVQGDTTPPISAPLTDEAGIPNLDGATVLFQMTMVAEAGDAAPPPVTGVCTVEADEDEARATYEWQDGDTDVPGVYRQDFRVNFASGDVEFFPSEPNTIIIRSALVP
jgi:hypothetical protein